MLPVTVVTKYDEETLVKINRLIRFRRTIILFIILGSLALLGMIPHIYLWCVLGEFDSFIILNSALLLFLVLWFFVILPAVMKKGVKKSLAVTGVRKCTALIHEDHMDVHWEGEKDNANLTSEYSAFTRVAESKEFFLIFTRQIVSHSLDKRSMTDEEQAAVRQVFQKAFPGKRYSVWK